MLKIRINELKSELESLNKLLENTEDKYMTDKISPQEYFES